MLAKTVEVKSWLATNIIATSHIELSIRNSVVAKWDQYINADVTYKEYYHSIQVTFNLKKGDKIIYKIYGNSFWNPEGGLLGVNFVKFQGEAITASEFLAVSSSDYSLGPIYPNPFSASTTVEFSLPKTDHVSIKIYNELGNEVATLEDRIFPVGHYMTTWNTIIFNSRLYSCRMKAGSYSVTKKPILYK